jgi:hypothetical protein
MEENISVETENAAPNSLNETFLSASPRSS